MLIKLLDYIRTYTWDKRLETWVKESAFMSGVTRGEPTIVTPKQYRQRFLAAMERYFPLVLILMLNLHKLLPTLPFQVPDRWMKLKDIPEEDSTQLLELWPDW